MRNTLYSEMLADKPWAVSVCFSLLPCCTGKPLLSSAHLFRDEHISANS
jgi:hypothetical protein